MTEQEAIDYFNNVTIDTNIGVENTIKTSDLINISIKALEKQIPKVPYYSGDGYYGGELIIDAWECPCCGKYYEVDYDDYEYCPNCGQHIDHSTFTIDD